MLQKLNGFINLKTGYRYWYAIKFIYKDKNNKYILDWTAQIGLLDKKDILNFRKLRKIDNTLNRDKSIRKYLCNGNINIEICCYLGRIKR